MPAAIEVRELKRLDHKTIRAIASVRLGGVTILGVKVIRVADQRPWIALPQVPGRAKPDGGSGGWYPVIALTPALMDRVRDAVLEAWGGEQAARPAAEPRQPPTSREARDRHIAELAARFDEHPDDSDDVR